MFLNPQDDKYWINRPLTDEKRDWQNQGENWVEDYNLSTDHPHRIEIIKAIISLSPVESVLEIGCNAGPNLKKISYAFTGIQLAGIDVNYDAIQIAKKYLPHAILGIGSAIEDYDFYDRSFGITICDAVLMYVPPEYIGKAAEEINRVTRKGIILCEWHDESEEGVVKDFHWARNYEKIFKRYGWELKNIKKITKEIWPSENWIKNGYIYVFHRPFQTSNKNFLKKQAGRSGNGLRMNLPSLSGSTTH